jgi:hypothetical protein
MKVAPSSRSGLVAALSFELKLRMPRSRRVSRWLGIPEQDHAQFKSNVRPWLQQPGWSLYLARVNGRPAAAATLYVHDNVAYLADSATDPSFRRRAFTLPRCDGACVMQAFRGLISFSVASSRFPLVIATWNALVCACNSLGLSGPKPVSGTTTIEGSDRRDVAWHLATVSAELFRDQETIWPNPISGPSISCVPNLRQPYG